MTQHHHARLNHRCWIGDVLTFDVRSAAVNRLEKRMTVAEIGPRHNAEPADKSGREIRGEIARERYGLDG